MRLLIAAAAILCLGVTSAGADDEHGRAVLGKDDRIQVVDQAPFRPVAFIEITHESGARATCTGTYIGPDAVLTAAHCLVSIEEGPAVAVLVNGALAADWKVPSAWLHSRSLHLDYALIRMPPGSTSTWWSLGVVEDLPLDGLVPTIYGYPGDKELGTMWRSSAEGFAVVTSIRLEYDIDTGPGQSGAPIVARNPDWLLAHTVIGIHEYGPGIWNRGLRMTETVVEQLESMCAEMDCVGLAIATSSDPPAPRPFLYEGWNVVEWTAAPSSGVTAVHAGLDSYVTLDAWLSVAAFDGGWIQTFRAAPLPAFNTLTALEEGRKYWIAASRTASLLFE